MSGIPDEIEGLGKTSVCLRQNPRFDTNLYAFDADSYFVWSRLDGHTSLRNIILMVGLPIPRTIKILQNLRAVGAILRPGETSASLAAVVEDARERVARAETAPATHEDWDEATPPAGQPPVPAPSAPPAGQPVRPAVVSRPRPARGERRPTGQVSALGGEPGKRPGSQEPPAASAPAGEPGKDALAGQTDEAQAVGVTLTEEEARALLAEVDLSGETKQQILLMRRKVQRMDFFTLFGVGPDVSNRDLKRAYFRLSKEFHPDRYYRKDTGPFGPFLAEIFQGLAKGFEVLSDSTARQRYESSLTGKHDISELQTPQEHAKELFERGCATEAGGDAAGALKLFVAAIRVDARSRYLRRAARCAIGAGELELAEEYAVRAVEAEPANPSMLRVLADVYRAAGKLGDAEKTLVAALELKSENDVLGKELESDLAQVRAALRERG